jgi:hypothetical protein
MRSGRPAAVLLLLGATLLAPALALGKDRVEATLTTKLALDAPPVSRLRVAWTLTYSDGHGRRRPFGANGVFVRLRSATSSGATTGVAPVGVHTGGRYSAFIVVPRGGIGGVEIGLRGFVNGRPGDLLFRIRNDPLG